MLNVVNLQLTSADLDRLESAIVRKTLPSTVHSFFFGVSDGSETDDDLAFIATAMSALEAGYFVFYSSSW